MGRRAGSGGVRRKAEQTRKLLLDAGVQLLRERACQVGDHVVAAALSHVRFTEVADRATAMVREQPENPHAKVTTGAIYNLWPNQVDYQVDLLLHVAQLQSVLVPGSDESADRFRTAQAAGVPVDKAVADLACDVTHHYQQDPLFRVELGFLVGARDRRVKQALAHRQETFFATADQRWQTVLDVYGLQLVTGHQLRDLTTAIATGIIGSTVLSYAHSDDEVDIEGRSLADRVAAEVAVAVFRAFTQHAG